MHKHGCLRPLSMESWPSKGHFFCLAVQVASRPRRQLHSIALYQFEGEFKFGDLQSHLKTRCAPASPSDSIFWISLDLEAEDQKVLAAKIESWLSKNVNRIPYSVASPGGVVFRDDVWVGELPGQGMTCSTFIVALFEELGYPFIDVSTWEQRDGDALWASSILELLGPGMDEQHVAVQRSLLGQGIRVRPSDIVGAGSLLTADTAVGLIFQEVDPVSNQIELCLLGAI